jgi:serine protease Do
MTTVIFSHWYELREPLYRSVMIAFYFAATMVMVALPTSTCVAEEMITSTIEHVQPRMVKIFGEGGFNNLKGYGTGFLVSPNGFIVTIWSHVLDSRVITVILNDGRRFDAKVIGAEPAKDIAVIKIEAEQLAYFDLKTAKNASPGTRILGFSNMFKVATGNEPVSVLHGVVTARTKLNARRGNYDMPYDGDVLIIDAITNNPGAAGGIVTTNDGYPVAIIGKELRDKRSQAWINYSVPIKDVTETINEIMTGKYKRKNAEADEITLKPRNYSPLDFGLIMVPNVLSRTPAYVDSIVPLSPAAKSGIRPDDLVVFVNDELVQSVGDIMDRLGALEGGDLLKIIVRRNNQLVPFEFDVPHKK